MFSKSLSSLFLSYIINLFFSRLKHSQAELKKKQSELKATEKGYKKDKDSFDAIEKNKAKLEVRRLLLWK